MTLQDKWEELADIKDELAVRDWFMGTSGNLAIKVHDNPMEFLVTAKSGKDKKKRTAEDFLLVDVDGNPVENTHLTPSAETLLHCAIYRETNAGCSLHIHTVANNVISELYGDKGSVDFQGIELIKAFGMWKRMPYYRYPLSLTTLIYQSLQKSLHRIFLQTKELYSFEITE